jgi:hypothetical protein
MKKSPITLQAPLGMVGSTKFGRYPKISVEQTYNMIISDAWLVNYAGYALAVIVKAIAEQGRGIFSSQSFDHIITVIDNKAYLIDINLVVNEIGTLSTSQGDVFIDENNANQIAICDQTNLYIYNTVTGVFTKLTLDFTPGYVAFQDTYFIAPAKGTPSWRLSASNDGLTWPNDAQHVGELETKPDNTIAAVRMPGKGNLLLVFGENVTEAWFDTGGQLFPYQKNTSFNIDYGCLNPATIAELDEVVVWLASNEKSGPIIMVSKGGPPEKISNDGIDFKLSELINPEDSYGFLFRQDGHLIYQITFHSDNLTYAFDFNTQAFFTITDPNSNYHIAKRVVFFNNDYYFISFNDGNLYTFSSDITTGAGEKFPRIRVCPTYRMPDNTRFIANHINFAMEQGINSGVYAIDMRASFNGGQQFGPDVRYLMNSQGNYSNKFDAWGLGSSNEYTPQFRFWSDNRVVIGEGTLEVYQ